MKKRHVDHTWSTMPYSCSRYCFRSITTPSNTWCATRVDTCCNYNVGCHDGLLATGFPKTGLFGMGQEVFLRCRPTCSSGLLRVRNYGPEGSDCSVTKPSSPRAALTTRECSTFVPHYAGQKRGVLPGRGSSAERRVAP